MVNDFLPYLILIYAAVCFFMVLLSWLNYQNIQTRIMKLSFYFWLIQVANFLLSGITSASGNYSIIALGSFIWPLFAYNLHQIMVEFAPDMREEKLNWVPILIGYSISLVLLFFDVSFTIKTLPGILSLGYIGLTICWNFYKHHKKIKMLPLEKFFLLLAVLMLIHMIDWAFLRPLESFAISGYSIYIVLVVGFASVLPAMALQVEGERQRAALEELVEDRTKQLFHQSKFSALGEMAAGIAHEINNPLAIIVGKTEQLLNRTDRGMTAPENLKSGLEAIQKTAFRISKIIGALREFSRDHSEQSFEASTVGEVLNEILIFCEERFRNHGIALQIEGDLNVPIRSRGPQLSQVFLNLLNNSFDAIEFNDEKWIKIKVRSEEGLVKIYVMDSGPKIPDAIMDKIMQPFFTTKEVGKGTGLGLAISKGIIEKHQGDLFIDANGTHTTFVVTLPA
jgi:signal transduction histidine kinase